MLYSENELKKRLKAIGCTVAVSRGDFPGAEGEAKNKC